MSNTIPVEISFEKWKQNPEFMKEYNALEDEFALAATLARARANACLSQKAVAEIMNTSQSAVARLEAGKPNVSLRSLRNYAKATGCRLVLSMVPLTSEHNQTSV